MAQRTAAPTTGIEWTDATWNPVIGCTPISAGCLNCYAATMANRQQQMPNARDYHPLDWAMSRPGEGEAERRARVGDLPHTNIRIAEVRSGRAVFTGDVRMLEHRLTAPLTWKKPRKVFACSMSDLFHASVPFDFIDKVFAIMALCPQHTFQVLTKRPERMAEYLTGIDDQRRRVMNDYANSISIPPDNDYAYNAHWPLPNVWLGTSVEDQKAAAVRIPHLRQCPAAVRFLSCEPLIEDVGTLQLDGIHWVIIGGESGTHARMCNVNWVRSLLRQCVAANVAPFVKQLGRHVECACNWNPGGWAKSHGHKRAECAGCGMQLPFRDRAGGDMAEWPQDLRIRQFPTPAAF